MNLLIGVVVFLSIITTIQGIFTLYLAVYAWDQPEKPTDLSMYEYHAPYFSFSTLIPAYQESAVIEDTLDSVSRIEYPQHLHEIIVICHLSDSKTIDRINEYIHNTQSKQIHLVIFDGTPITKAHALNMGYQASKNDIIAIFDAEDEPHKDIYALINSSMRANEAEVIQSGIQLMNYRSSWFSAINVLEYFFWFKSALHFFAKKGIVPLGGNTIFVKRHWIDYIGGWNMHSLTEDAEIGIRLSKAHAKIQVMYNEEYSTKEETPPTLLSFIRQRTRWNQGFLQILLEGSWIKLPSVSQRLYGLYLLVWPYVQTLFFLYLVTSIVITFTAKLPVPVVIISLIPLYILLLQKTLAIVGMIEFTKNYNIKADKWIYIKILLTFYPFYFILGISAFRAVFRSVFHHINWEKTPHINAHRAIRSRGVLQYAPTLS